MALPTFADGQFLTAAQLAAMEAAITAAQATADGALPRSLIGATNGVLGLDANGLFQILSGSTSQRPGTAATGTQYLDTTLGFVITRYGSNWINAAGAVV